MTQLHSMLSAPHPVINAKLLFKHCLQILRHKDQASDISSSVCYGWVAATVGK